MRRWWYYGLLLLLASHAMAEQPWLNVRFSNQEYPPYMGQALPAGGILSRLVNEVFLRAQVNVRYDWFPNQRAIEMARNGQTDGSLGWAPSDERKRDLLFSEPVMHLRMVFFQRKDRQHGWQHLSDLAPLRIGVTAGNFYSSDFERLQNQGLLQLDVTSDDVSNFRKLEVGRIDLFPMDMEAGMLTLRAALPPARAEHIVPQTKAFFTAPLCVVIWRKHPQAAELIQRFNRELRRMRQSGQLQKLLEQTRQEIYIEQARQIVPGPGR